MAVLRNPIHPTLVPEPIVWKRTKDSQLGRLAALSADGLLEVPEGANPAAAHHARIINRHTFQPLRFVRVIPASDWQAAEFTLEITQILRQCRVLTPEALDVRPLDPQSVAVSYRWMEGKYPLRRDLDFSALGRAVARFHTALSDLKPVARLHASTTDRFNRLLDARSRLIKNRVLMASIAEDAALQAITDFPQLAESALLDAATGHGDLNPANILETPKGFAFLDFEDVHHMHVWWGFDLAKIVERLILTRAGLFGDDWAGQASEALLRGYFACASAERQPRDFGSKLVDAMRWHVGVSLLTVLDAPAHAAFAAETAKLAKLASIVKTNEVKISRLWR